MIQSFGKNKKERKITMAICIGQQKDEKGKVTSYKILENGKSSTYDREYLTQLLKTGKKQVENMSYDEKSCSVIFHVEK